jgi:hypothetical protein
MQISRIRCKCSLSMAALPIRHTDDRPLLDLGNACIAKKGLRDCLCEIQKSDCLQRNIQKSSLDETNQLEFEFGMVVAALPAVLEQNGGDDAKRFIGRWGCCGTDRRAAYGIASMGSGPLRKRSCRGL